MPFLKMNLCESTQAAMDVFQLFRNDAVNRYKDYKDLDEDEEPRIKQHEEGFSLSYVARMLDGTYDQVKVYDMVNLTDAYGEYSEREVEFIIRCCDGNKTIFRICVTTRFNIDIHEERDYGGYRWKMKWVKILHVGNKHYGSSAERWVREYYLKVTRYPYPGISLTRQVYDHVGGLVYQVNLKDFVPQVSSFWNLKEVRT